jgi:hypothetical protein
MPHMQSSAGVETDNVSAWCVIWSDKGEAPPEDLAKALAAKGVTGARCAHAYQAMSELCAGEKQAQSTPAVLLLVEPRRLAGAAALVRAMERYTARAVCWVYEESANPRLRALVESDVERWAGGGGAPAAGEEHARTRPSAPALRLTDTRAESTEPFHEGDEGRRTEVDPGDEREGPRVPSRQALTDEELSMLLDEGGDKPRERPPKNRGRE